MKIATVDSACSILNENLLPTNILSMVGIVVDHPYKQPSYICPKDKEYSLTDYALLINELKLCEEMLAVEKADYVHLDVTLGGINILELKDEDLMFKIPLSNEGRTILRLILPELQNVAKSIKEKYDIPVLAIGKKSHPVRLAELHAAAYGMAKAIDKAKEAKSTIFVGLPVRTSVEILEGKVRIASQEPMETDLYAEAPTTNGVSIEPFHNPIVRGFQTVKITPEG
ncbi:MAG: DUF4152 family protein [Candidatus Poribacteria bacterium]